MSALAAAAPCSVAKPPSLPPLPPPPTPATAPAHDAMQTPPAVELDELSVFSLSLSSQSTAPSDVAVKPRPWADAAAVLSRAADAAAALHALLHSRRGPTATRLVLLALDAGAGGGPAAAEGLKSLVAGGATDLLSLLVPPGSSGAAPSAAAVAASGRRERLYMGVRVVAAQVRARLPTRDGLCVSHVCARPLLFGHTIQVLDVWYNAGGDLQVRDWPAWIALVPKLVSRTLLHSRGCDRSHRLDVPSLPPVQMDLIHALLDDGDNNGSESESERRHEAEADVEAREAAQCLAMAEAVLGEGSGPAAARGQEGSGALGELAARLRCSGHAGLLPQRNNSNGSRRPTLAAADASAGGGGADAEDDVEAVEEEVEVGAAEGPPSGGAGESGPGRHRRLARDTAGTVLLWLLCLQVRTAV